MWPLLDDEIRESLNTKRETLQTRLIEVGILKHSTFFALFGSRKETAVATIILLTPNVVPKGVLQEISTDLSVINLRYLSSPASRETLLQDYVQSPNPGTIIGAEDRPTTSFSSGWWVRDCHTGSVFNLTVAHPLRKAAATSPYAWSVVTESLESQRVDSPPVCVINATCLELRQEINELQSHRRSLAEMEEKTKELEDVRRILNRKDFATVVAAGYGEFQDEDDVQGVMLVEDWGLLRARSDRIGMNVFPPMTEFSRYFTGIGPIKIGIKCVINGATSGVREGVVVDEIVECLDEHDQQTKTWVVVEKGYGTFGQEGDSGSPIGLEGGLAGGTYVSGGIGIFDDEYSVPVLNHHFIANYFEKDRECNGKKVRNPIRIRFVQED